MCDLAIHVSDRAAKLSFVTEQCCDGSRISRAGCRTELTRIEDSQINPLKFFRIQIRLQQRLILFEGDTTCVSDPCRFDASRKELFKDF